MRLPALILITVFPLCGCDIFLDDVGGDGMPCYEQNDCQKGFICDQNLCHKPLDQTPFATECQPAVQESCKGEFGECVCFPGMNCYCTRPCNGAHECDYIDIGGSSARCTLMDPKSLQGICADWQWTSSYGNLCIPGDIECDNGLCATFPGGDLHVCTTLCTVGCPAEYACQPAVQPTEGVCGIEHWFGFWRDCVSSADCDAQFPEYTNCWNDQKCSKFCGTDEDCPFGAYCDNPGTGNCIPDM